MSNNSPEFYPICARGACFGNNLGKCTILTSSIFKHECPFFKTNEQLEREHEHTKERFHGMGKEVRDV